MSSAEHRPRGGPERGRALRAPRTSPAALCARRERLSAALAARGVDSACLVSGWARARNFAHNVYPFRAESHFLYLTGLQVEGAVLALEDGSWTLYVTAEDEDAVLWHGPAPSLEELGAAAGCVAAPLDELPERLEAAVLPPQDDETAAWLGALIDRDVEAQGGPALEGRDAALAAALVDVRLLHDEAALAQLRFAAEGSALAHRMGMASTRGADSEAEVRGAMLGSLYASGLVPAYEPIVTVHGEVLHERASRRALAPGELLLADVGGETPEGWAGDVTRTWPVSGRFTGAQRAVYELVLETQRAAIAAVKPGARFGELHVAAARRVAEGLRELGLASASADALVESGAASVFFPHGLGHLLGLDVHDLEDLGDRAGYAEGQARREGPLFRTLRLDRVLQVGMVVTVEPGFYLIPSLLARAAEDTRLRDLLRLDRVAALEGVRGIRIEDDVQVTATGAEVLSARAPKEPAAIEALLGG